MPCDELTICRCHYVKNAVGPGLAAVLRNRWICGSRWIGANRAFCGSVGPCRWIGVPQTACIGHYPNLVIAAGPSRGSTLEQTATPRLWPQASQIRAVRFVPQKPSPRWTLVHSDDQKSDPYLRFFTRLLIVTRKTL